MIFFNYIQCQQLGLAYPVVTICMVSMIKWTTCLSVNLEGVIAVGISPHVINSIDLSRSMKYMVRPSSSLCNPILEINSN